MIWFNDKLLNNIFLQCLKESYVKAVGVGIGHDLQAIEFKLQTPKLSKEVGLLLSFSINLTCNCTTDHKTID